MRQTQTTRRRRLRRRFPKGIALPWAAIIILVMVLMVGLSIDMAIAAVGKHQSQNASDAAALAGAQIVKRSPVGDVIDRAWDTANKNQVMKLAVELNKTVQTSDNVDTIDVIVGRWVTYNNTFVPTFDAPNAVKAVVRRGTREGGQGPISLIFGHMVSPEAATVALESRAIAWCNDSSGSGLICLSSSARPGLYLSSNANLDVEGGGIHVNSVFYPSNPSGNDSGTRITGNAKLDAGFINTVGGVTPGPEDSAWERIFEGGAEGVEGFSVTEGADPVEDPLAAAMLGNPLVTYDPAKPPDQQIYDRLKLPELINSGVIPTHDIPTVEGTATLAPGYYPNGISLSNGSDVTLAPTAASGVGTIFIFGGGTKKNNNNIGLYMTGGKLQGNGVTCYVTQNFDSGVYGLTRLTGGEVSLTSPGDWRNIQAGTTDVELVRGLDGIAIWQDPANPNEVHLNGNADFDITGTLYFPDPIHVKLEGNLGQAGNQILCGSATVLGGATISVDYDGRNAGEPTFRSMLVK